MIVFVFVFVFVVQLPGCGEAALHAHPPSEAPGAENRRPVHREAAVSAAGTAVVFFVSHPK